MAKSTNDKCRLRQQSRTRKKCPRRSELELPFGRIASRPKQAKPQVANCGLILIFPSHLVAGSNGRKK